MVHDVSSVKPSLLFPVKHRPFKFRNQSLSYQNSKCNHGFSFMIFFFVRERCQPYISLYGMTIFVLRDTIYSSSLTGLLAPRILDDEHVNYGV